MAQEFINIANCVATNAIANVAPMESANHTQNGCERKRSLTGKRIFLMKTVAPAVFLIMLNIFTLLVVMLTSCEVRRYIEDEEVEEDDKAPANYITFKYNGTAYNIANDETCVFTNHFDEYYQIEGSDPTRKQALSITIGTTLKAGGTYDIYASSPYETAIIRILFSEGTSIAEESFYYTGDAVQVTKIGKLTVKELSGTRLSGTFECRTINGEITDGTFSVKAKGS
ncbi:MAG: hypothetical protein LBR18_00005 [Tannerella sp.]|jgi:hypothetical protein|nr:hypothetical protein [Tannerella sp.]